jgi:hypothetical protein
MFIKKNGWQDTEKYFQQEIYEFRKIIETICKTGYSARNLNTVLIIESAMAGKSIKEVETKLKEKGIGFERLTKSLGISDIQVAAYIMKKKDNLRNKARVKKSRQLTKNRELCKKQENQEKVKH